MTSQAVKWKMLELQRNISSLTREADSWERELTKTCNKAQEIEKLISDYQTKRDTKPAIMSVDDDDIDPIIPIIPDYKKRTYEDFSDTFSDTKSVTSVGDTSSDTSSQCSTNDSEVDFDTKERSYRSDRASTFSRRFFGAGEGSETEKEGATFTTSSSGRVKRTGADRFKTRDRRRSQHEIKIV